ncbi:MAG: lysophospholipid acyltransferase family protein [Gemmatimonadota bacterium]|nr:lysophospholipid acyltransferase family protein [Gemmatimonadota bacterium]
MSDLKYEAAGLVGARVLGALFLTTTVRRSGVEHYERFRSTDRPVVFVTWHGQLLPLVHVHRRQGIVVLVSEHGDGEYITRVMERLGFSTVRGSSTRGGTKGLRGLLRAAKAGHDLALTPDGPRGPAGVFKPGALAVARLTGAPVIPIAMGASSAWRVGSWDGFLVPKPGSRISIEYLPPRFVPRDAARGDLERIAEEIGRALNECTARLSPAGREPSEERGS